jgi:hypothetical protein
MIALRYLLYGMLAVAIATSVWVGLRRLSWEAEYQTVGLAIPYQELETSHENDMREHLAHLRAQGVVALTVELSAFPDWNLERVALDDRFFRVAQRANEVGLSFAFVVTPADISQAQDGAQALLHTLGIPPQFLFIVPASQPLQETLPNLHQILDNNPVLIGTVEFSEAPGLLELYNQGWRSFVRVHAMKPRELDRLGLDGALTRWERAVQERNIRLLWVTEHRRFLQYVERLNQRITKLGMSPGQPPTPTPFESSYVLYLLIGAGAVSFVMLVSLQFARFHHTLIATAISLGVIAWGGLWDLQLGRQILALMLASLSPWLLVVFLRERLSGWKLLLTVSAGSMAAGLSITALLSDLSYFLKLNEFRGVKVALIAPSLLIVLTGLWHWRGLNWSVLKTQLQRGSWLIPAAGLGALFLVLERSGNLPLIPVARWEELVRERLEDWLTARPRFKEFLIGHPALLLWETHYAQSPNLMSWGLLALGALGQASIVNTFVHLHTPLLLSLWRTLNGFILGILVGILLRYVLSGIRQWRLRRSS